MALRTVAAFAGSAALTTGVLYHRGVRADQGEGKRVKIRELSPYDSPVKQQYELIIEESLLESYVRPARQGAWKMWDELSEKRQQAFELYLFSKNEVQSFVDFLQAEEGATAFQRGAFILMCTIGGGMIGARRGELRAALYSLMGLGTGVALIYPKPCIDFSQRAWVATKCKTKDAYVTVFPRTEDQSSMAEQFERFIDRTKIKVASKSEPTLKVAEKTSKQIVESVADVIGKKEEVMEAIEMSEKKKEKKNIEDHGQSSEEDKDMYTTRDSS